VANIDLVSPALYQLQDVKTELGLDDRAYLAGFQVKGRCFELRHHRTALEEAEFPTLFR
jgi:hypothetical protein